jgi:hypothetical protein
MIRTTPRAVIGWSLVMRGRPRTAAVATMKRSQGSASESIGADVDRSAIRAVTAVAVTLMPGILRQGPNVAEGYARQAALPHEVPQVHVGRD